MCRSGFANRSMPASRQDYVHPVGSAQVSKRHDVCCRIPCVACVRIQTGSVQLRWQQFWMICEVFKRPWLNLEREAGGGVPAI